MARKPKPPHWSIRYKWGPLVAASVLTIDANFFQSHVAAALAESAIALGLYCYVMFGNLEW